MVQVTKMTQIFLLSDTRKVWTLEPAFHGEIQLIIHIL